MIVAVDNKTFQDINGFPFPRADYAQLINNIAAEHPKAIVFDIELADKTTVGGTCKIQGTSYPCDDLALLTAISNHPGVTAFDTTAPEANGSGQIRFLGSTEGTTLLEQLGSRAGAALFPTEPARGTSTARCSTRSRTSRRCTWSRRRWPAISASPRSSSAAIAGSTIPEPSTRSRGSPSRASMTHEVRAAARAGRTRSRRTTSAERSCSSARRSCPCEDFHATSTDPPDGRGRDRGRRDRHGPRALPAQLRSGLDQRRF